ncbi:hypothetical protein SUGI_0663950 [Cryptomeria japonica]|uniref:thioredoxin X, chloroplastic isoform X2 n=1 Tax=Cryptomeria japonica TaxID=3369 RepID=UPI002414B61C|nr:thioredoxin X, chloroplastic isoform X2 [Cryptomeria japonica]GLJ32972.1 hypothetical protein SUGI_0663950 [Cryptomeria japonica]
MAAMDICKLQTFSTSTVTSAAGCRGLMKGLMVTCKASSVGESEFEEKVVNSELPVLVDFVADWCGPCKLVAPIIDWASEEYSGKLKVFKIDHDANPQLVEKFKVYGLPTLILFKDGKEVLGSRREGAITKDKLKAYLDQLLESVATL